MTKPIHKNLVTFKVTGKNALFTDPLTKIGGEKCTYQIPTYEALKGIISSVYWKPTFIWFINRVRIMNPIQTESKGIRPLKMGGGNDLATYTYLKDVEYQVEAYFEWNDNRLDLENDRNENKHHNIAQRMIERGGRRDIFLGTRECQGYVEPCSFGDNEGYYDDINELSFGLMYHGITYPDENENNDNSMNVNFWYPKMRNGIIEFLRPEECPAHKYIHSFEKKKFSLDENNFRGLNEFQEENIWD